jgi:hypothetical protein
MVTTRMTKPRNKLTLGSTALENVLLSAKITRVENGFDTATIVLPNKTYSYYPSTVTQGTTVLLEVKDEGLSYTTVFAGTCRFVIADVGTTKTLTLSCLGTGFGLGEMLSGEEYGAQSKTPATNTVTEILTDLKTNQLNKVFSGAASGFSYTTSCTLANSIPYIIFPYKPVDKCLNDIIDLVTAQEAGSAGPHWIVTTDAVIHLHTIGSSQVGWTKYYGNSQTNATLTYGIHYKNINLEKMSPEANYIVYYGQWRRPSNGDFWTENNAASWGATDCTVADDTAAGNFKVNTASIRYTRTHAVNIPQINYPSTLNWGYDLSSAKFKEYNVPSLKFWLKRDGVTNGGWVDLVDSTAQYFRHSYSTQVPDANRWYNISVPVGDYCNIDGQNWVDSGSADWSDIQYISFGAGVANGGKVWVDGLHFGDAAVCRVAYNSTSITANGAKMRLITDNVGKDDTLTSGTPGTTDIGLMAQLAYSELLRLQTTSLVGTVDTPMIPDLLPGQLLYIQSTDFRVTKIVHTITGKEYGSSISITDDVTNGRSRPRYEDVNKQWAAVRPEWQDRQAASIKAGSVDIRIARLAENYG